MSRTAYKNINALIYLRENNALPIVSVMAVQFAVTVFNWTPYHHTRKALGHLTDTQLRDVGLTPLQARREAARLFWQIRLFRHLADLSPCVCKVCQTSSFPPDLLWRVFCILVLLRRDSIGQTGTRYGLG